MRTAILLLLTTQTAAQLGSPQCSINAGRAVDEMMDSIVYIWASVQRCSTPGTVINCEIDVASSAQSVNAMVNVLIRALKDCDGLKTNECGVAAGHLTEASAGLAAAGGGVIDKCHSKQDYGSNGRYQVALCIVNVKDATRSLLFAVQKIIMAQQACEKDEELCAADATYIVSAFSGMAQYISGAIGRCSKGPLGSMHDINAACAEQATSFVRFASSFASSATQMSLACKESAARLYEVRAKNAKVQGSSMNTMTFSLLALLPMTGFMAFYGGSRFGKFRGTQHEERHLAVFPGENIE